jgi:hypothetical protein
MSRKSRGKTKTYRTSLRKSRVRKSRGGKSRGGKSRGGKSRKKTRYTPDEFITSDRVITRFSEVFKHPINYVTKSTIPFYLDKKTLDPINSAELSSLAAHIGLDASEM